MPEDQLHPCTAAVEQWYAVNARDLPWRHTCDPYRIWLSEIILQQTRIAQGTAYYLRFVERFPYPTDLATASEDEVLRLWQGLGYYSRARNLLAAARSMKDGKFPRDYTGIRALKGTGDYTAAAVASIACGLPYAAIDGNVVRVLSRCFGITIPYDTARGKREIRTIADNLLDHRNPGLSNQAYMELGALVCLPRTPACQDCPLAPRCAALATGQIDTLPVRKQPTSISIRHMAYVFVTDSKHRYTWLHKRTANDIWKGLYEFPLFETADTGSDITLTPAFRTLFDNTPLSLKPVAQGIRHVLTHRIILADFYLATTDTPGLSLPGYFRIPLPTLRQYALPRLLTKMLDRLPV